MSGRREVNVERPEHSWIPFYRELAEKLVNDGWRERQEELVGVLKEMRSRGLLVHPVVISLENHIDPFTVMAMISRGEVRWDNTKAVMEAYKEQFEVEAEIPDVKPFIPYARYDSVGYFGPDTDIEIEGAKLWDLLESILEFKSSDVFEAESGLAELIDKCIEIDWVGITKLSGALYWVDPHKFLRTDSLHAALRDENENEVTRAADYLDSLAKLHKLTSRPFPEINVDEYLSRETRSQNQMWLVRAYGGEWTDAFVEYGYIGIGYGMDEVDLSKASTTREIQELYETARAEKFRRGKGGHDIGNIRRFVLDIKAGDYVVTPRRNGQTLHYGEVETGVTYHAMVRDSGPCRNRKDVIWSDKTLHRRSIGTFSWSQVTISRVNDGSKRAVFAHMLRNGLPKRSKAQHTARSYSIDDMLNEGMFFERDELERIRSRFVEKKNLILQGPPGVGKTFMTRRLAYALMGEQADDRIVNVQFHQSYSYEEFVRGYRPSINKDQQLIFEPKDGAFLRLCYEARKEGNEGKKFVMVIDEINRGNLSRVFGELLSLIENDKRGDGFSVELVGGERFSVPENVYLLGTMNLADRSLAGMDYAMRRRFAFVTLKPQFGESVFEDWLRDRDVPDTMIERINDRMSALNEVIAGDASLGRNFAVGHSYFCDVADGGEDDWDGWYREIVETEIQPLLEEYWFDDLGKADGEVGKLLEG